uniref:Uncharacterized protein n=1 Tax=Glossina brevipalpis TaxID=37001 RepID=A0A1A9W4S4_9MUSC
MLISNKATPLSNNLRLGCLRSLLNSRAIYLKIVMLLGLITAIGADVSDLFAHSNNLQEDGYHYDRPVGYEPFSIHSKYDTPRSELYEKKPVVPQYESRKLQTAFRQELPKYEIPLKAGPKPLQQFSKLDTIEPTAPTYKRPETSVSKYNTPKSQLTISKFSDSEHVFPKYEAAREGAPKYDVPKFQRTKSLLEVPTPLVPKYENLQLSNSKYTPQEPQSILTKYERSKPAIANSEVPRPFVPKYEAPKQEAVTVKYQASKNLFTNYESPKPFTFKTQIPPFVPTSHTVQSEINEYNTHKSSFSIHETPKPIVAKLKTPELKLTTDKHAPFKPEKTNYATLNPKYESEHHHPLAQKFEDQQKNDIFTYDKSKPPKAGELREDGYHYEVPQKAFEIVKPAILTNSVVQQKLKSEYSPSLSQSTTALPHITTKTAYVVTTTSPRPSPSFVYPIESISHTSASQTSAPKNTVIITPKPKTEYFPHVANAVHVSFPSYKTDAIAVKKEYSAPIIQQTFNPEPVAISSTHKPISSVTPQQPIVPTKIINEYFAPKHANARDNVQPILSTIPTYKPILAATKYPDTQKPGEPQKITNEYIPPKQKIAAPIKVQQTPQSFVVPTTSTSESSPLIPKKAIISPGPTKLSNEYFSPKVAIVSTKEQTQQPIIVATTPVYKSISEVTQVFNIPNKLGVPRKFTNEYVSQTKPIIPGKAQSTQRPAIVATTLAYESIPEITKSTTKTPEVLTKLTNEYLPPQLPVTPAKVESTQHPILIATTSTYKPILEVTKFSGTSKKPVLPFKFTKEYLPPQKPVDPVKVEPTPPPITVISTPAYKPTLAVTKFSNIPKPPEVPAKFTNEYLPPPKPVVPVQVQQTQRPVTVISTPAYKPIPEIITFSSVPKIPEVLAKFTNEYVPPKPVVPVKVQPTQPSVTIVSTPAYKPTPEPLVPVKVQPTQPPVTVISTPAYKPTPEVTKLSSTQKTPENPTKFTNEYVPPPPKPLVPVKDQPTQRPVTVISTPAYKPTTEVTKFSTESKIPETPAKFSNEYLPPSKPVIPVKVQPTQRPVTAISTPAYEPTPEVTTLSSTPKPPEVPAKFTNEYIPPPKPIVPVKVQPTQRPVTAISTPAYKPIPEVTKFSSVPKLPEFPVKFANEYVPPLTPIVPVKVQTTHRPVTVISTPAYKPTTDVTKFFSLPKIPEVPAKFTNEYLPPPKPVVPVKIQPTQRPVTVSSTPAYKPTPEVIKLSSTQKTPENPTKFTNEYLPPPKPVVPIKVQPTQRPVAVSNTSAHKPTPEVTKLSSTPKTPEIPAKFTNEYLPPSKPVVPVKVEPTQLPVVAAVTPAYKPTQAVAAITTTHKPFSIISESPVIKQKPTVTNKVVDKYLPPNTTHKPVSSSTKYRFTEDERPKLNYEYLPPKASFARVQTTATPFKAITTSTKKPTPVTGKYTPPTQKKTESTRINKPQSKKPGTVTTKSVNQKVSPKVKNIDKQSKPVLTAVTKTPPSKQITTTTKSPIITQKPGKPFKAVKNTHNPTTVVPKLPAKSINQGKTKVSKPAKPDNQYLPPVTKESQPSRSSPAPAKPHRPTNQIDLVKQKTAAPSRKSSPTTKVPKPLRASSPSPKRKPLPNKTVLVTPKPSIPIDNSKKQLPATPNPFVNTANIEKPTIPPRAKIEHLPSIAKFPSIISNEKPKTTFLPVNPTNFIQSVDVDYGTPNLPHQGYYYPNNPQPPFSF